MSASHPARRRHRPDPSDVLERALDKGIVFDFSGALALAGLQIVGATGQVTIVSMELYLEHEPTTPSTSAVIAAVEDYLRRLPPEDS